MRLDQALDTPLYTGGLASATDVPKHRQVSIGTHSYVIDESQYSRQTVDSLRPFSDGGTDVGENSLNPQALWRRAALDWSLGANQAYFDEPQTSDRRRFLSSKGADIWTPRQVTCLPGTAANGPTDPVQMFVIAGNFYCLTASGKVTNLSGATLTDFATTMIKGQITTDGTYVYATPGNILKRATVGVNTFATLGSATATTIGHANGRLLGALANALSEITAAGASVPVFTHPNASFVWDGIISAPHGSYAFGHVGDHSEVYVIGVVDATGQLAAPVYAGETNGEVINDLEFYGGIMAIATTRGFRLANVTSQGGLVQGPLVRIAGGCNDLCFDGRFIWSTWTNYDATSTGLLRMDPARFTFPLVPAYASDLMATGQGKVTCVCYDGVGNAQVPVVFGVTGLGIITPTLSSVVATIDPGVIRFGVTDPKLLVFADLRHAPLGAVSGGSSPSITVALQIDDGSQITLGTSGASGTTAPVSPFSAGNLSAENPHLLITLTPRTNGTAPPILYRWLLKGLPTPVAIDTIQVPIMMATRVVTEIGDGDEVTYDTAAEYAYLRSLVSSRQVVPYREGSRYEQVYVEGLQIKAARWNPKRTYFEGIYMAQLKTLG